MVYQNAKFILCNTQEKTMNNNIRKIREAQMKILFRGSDSYVMQRNITDNDLDRLRLLNIELLRHHLPSLDENNKSRALRTIQQLKKQMEGAGTGNNLNAFTKD